MVESSSLNLFHPDDHVFCFIDRLYILSDEEIDPSGIIMKGDDGLSGAWSYLISPLWALKVWGHSEIRGVISFKIKDITKLNFNVEYKPNKDFPFHVVIKGLETFWDKMEERSKIQLNLKEKAKLIVKYHYALCEHCSYFQNSSSKDVPQKGKCRLNNNDLIRFQLVVKGNENYFNLSCFYYKKGKQNCFILNPRDIDIINKYHCRQKEETPETLIDCLKFSSNNWFPF